ncbi:VOC family protein [Thalassotalea euphylliae]|uniref:VOC family protein n=1 Tax=Thalassotalea euphylliae TaxID=1655234 RepID=A0A3E0TZ21_9GAMM|nr:VOC family protein [Thalassotalea euphylliae]REL29623.1 VOC family protein [Thalassotalea euphylliae]
MKLGAFSISLNVKDIKRSYEFYQKLGFIQFGGDIKQKWLILQNEDKHIIGLFEGMLDNNTLTFNPGWDQSAQPLTSFDDVRKIQAHLLADGVNFVTQADSNSEGPASFVVLDPDGNPILVDQHR